MLNLEKDKEEDSDKKELQPEDPDIILNIPKIEVGEIKIKVKNLDAHVSLNGSKSDRVNINVGAFVHIGKVDIVIENVSLETYLTVNLGRIRNILKGTELDKKLKT